MDRPSSTLERQAALACLSRSAAWEDGDRTRAFREVAETATRVLRVARASIWLYTPDRAALVCDDLYHAADASHVSGARLERSDFPRYFEALEAERAIAAGDAHTDVRTREFSTTYLGPLGIGALLDVPILRSGRSVGVLCHEHVGAARDWTHEDELLAASLGDFVALALAAEEVQATQASLREREHELRLALEAARMGTWQWDPEPDRFCWSDEVAALLGVERSALPKDLPALLERIPAAERSAVADAFHAAGATPEAELSIDHWVLRPDGTRVRIHAQGRRQATPTARLLGVVNDVTERHRMEAELERAKRLDGLAQLSGHVAHDFNNLLTIILGCASALQLRDPSCDLLNKIQTAGQRGADLAGQLLAFAKREEVVLTATDVNASLRALEDLAEPLLGADVGLTVRPCAEGASVWLGRGQLEQILLNLALNARDAMPNGGRIEVGGALPGDGTVEIAVADQGAGIAPDVLPRVFDPFFTTKPPGKGSGLGLSSCYGIVTRAGGELKVETAPGRGSTFRIRLPLASV